MFRELGVGVSGGVLGKEAAALLVSLKIEPRVDCPGSSNGERSWHRAFLCPLICSPQVRQRGGLRAPPSDIGVVLRASIGLTRVNKNLDRG